jgi:UDP-N-acetylmuramyl pentapeptide phosphotransferase/UDP-N-acetylglucosamine-1-phosphate transferase
MTQPTGPLAPTGATHEDEERTARVANRFDIRRLIGAVFLLYGIVLTVLGLVGTSNVKNKAAGINIDLWTGLGMLVFAVFMIAWALLRPVRPEPPEIRGRGSGRIRRAPAT